MKTISTWNKLIPFFAGLFLSILFVTSVTGTVTAAQNLDSWSSTKGTLNPADVTPSRFRFIDPTTIEDTVTGDTYTTSASQDELYSNNTRGHMRDPGWFWYWPGDDDGPVINSSDSNPQCTGGLVLRATDANNDEIGSLSLYAVGAIKIGSSCAVPNGSASDYDGIQSDTKGKGDDPHDDNEYELTQVDNSTYRMAVAMFVWNNQNNIGVYDSSKGLRKLTDTELQLVKNRTGETYPSSTLWTHDDCEQDNGLPNAFLLVANSDKDVGRVFYDANNTYHGSWSGDQLTCLMGRELKDNQTDLANTVSDNSNVVYIAHQENAGADGEPPVDGVDNTGGSGTGTASNGDSCEDSGWELSWIACPLLFGADKALNWITEQINHLLQVPDSYIRPDSDPEALQNIWSRFRDIAYMILIPIMLVMVISTALGFDFFSAYTVKKAMPRMVLAIMFITFSFYITEFLVLLTNDVGKGTHGLIIGVVKPGGEDITLASLFEPQGVQDSVFWGTAGVLALAGTAAVAGVTVLLSYAFTTIIVLIIGLFLLALRQMLIIGLMVFAPLAILSWIFPGNDKLWKLWWGSFSKLLLMFPLIMALIATGKIFGFIVEQSSSASDAGNGQLLFTGLKLLAFVAPFFFIPATFKFAGGVFGTLTGMANDRARGLFDRQKRYRGKKMGENWQDSRNFNRFKGSGAVSRRANSLFGYGANVNKAGLNPRRMAGKLGAARSDREILGREAMMGDDDYTWKGNDTLNRAAAESRNSGELRDMLRRSGDYNGPDGTANLERDVAKVEGMRRKYGDKAFRQATFLQAVRGGTAYQGAAEPWRAAASIADGDNAVLADLVAKGKGAAMEAGRVDQGGAGFGEIMTMASQFRNNPDYDMGLANRQFTSAVYDAQGGNVLSHSSMKGQAVDNMIPVMQERLDAALASGNGDAVDAELANLANVYDTLSATKPELGQRFAQDIMNHGISADSLAPNLQQDFDSAINTETGRRSQFNVLQAIDARRGDDRFKLRRREYDRSPETRGGGRPPAAPGDGPVPPVGGRPT